ncbi:hypothetical protein EDB19DRAFT_1830998 [Suillus lakei]|nr:hypothetical protein EDB19DRAFT_1830998 [Suillus lakei]
MKCKCLRCKVHMQANELSKALVTLLDVAELEEKHISTEVKIIHVYPLWPPGLSSNFPYVWNVFRPTIGTVKTLSRDGAFFAGDSAHIAPPTGGQALDLGMQDALQTMVEAQSICTSDFTLGLQATAN